jgi:hypothetical protein
MADPWTIGDRFTQMLYNDRANRLKYDMSNQQLLARERFHQQDAATLFARQLERDAANAGYRSSAAEETYKRQLERDKAAREFRHNENYLTHVTYWHNPADQFNLGDLTADPTAQQPAAPPPTGQPPAPAGTPPPQGVDTMPTGAIEGPTGGATDASGRVTPQSAYGYLTSRGMPPMVAAGIVGNIDVETGWDQNVFMGTRRGDAGSAGYSGQWRGSRLQHLHEFAQSRGHSAPTPEDQLDFYFEEAQSGRDAGARMAFERASQAKTPEEAAQAFMDHYERPNPQYANAGRRMSAARAIYGSGGAGAAPATTQRRYGMSIPASAYAPSADMSMYGDEGAEPDPFADDLYGQEVQDAQAEADFVAPDQNAQPWGMDDFSANGIDPTLAGVPDDMDVVGTGMYSDTGVQLMPQDMQQRILPTGKAPNQYLIMQPKMSTQGTQAPAPVIQQIPTGQKTRRNAQGQLEVNVDGQWQVTGG